MKRVKLYLILLGALFLFIPKLNASTGYISVYSNKNTLVVGNTIDVTVTVKSEANIGAWEFTISYDSSKLQLVSGKESYKEWYTYANQKSQAYYYTFRAKTSGTSVITVKSYAIADKDTEQYMTTTVGSETITAITQAQLEASYSTNNNLSSLTIDKGVLSPEFNKDTLEYTVSVPSDTEKVTIGGSKEDRTASVSGFGEFDVSEGDNNFEIAVTAQNGAVKKYKVKVVVEDTNPIGVIVDNKKYTVVKRASSLTAPFTFNASTIKINDIDIPSFHSDITNFNLVGLKDEEGNISLFIYDEKENSYTLYNELNTTSLKVFIKEGKALEGFKLDEIEMNNQKVKAYINEKYNDLIVLYGINIENNEEGYYQYDKSSNTLIKYNDSLINEINSLNKRNENYLLIIIVLGVEIVIVTFILLVSFFKRNKRRKKALKIYEERKKEHEKKHKNENKTIDKNIEDSKKQEKLNKTARLDIKDNKKEEKK